MAISEFKLDVFAEIDNSLDFKYELRILDKTIDELEKIISEQRGKYRTAAKLALAILKKKEIKKIKTPSGNVDDLLVNLSKKPDILVATQDLGLKRRLSKPYITIRQKRKFVLVW